MSNTDGDEVQRHGRLWWVGLAVVVISVIITIMALAKGGWRLDVALTVGGSMGVIVGVILLSYGSVMPAHLTRIRSVLQQSTDAFRASVQEQLITRMEFAREYGRLGLVEIHSDCTKFDYEAIITESQRLIVLLNDGRTWSSVHRNHLRKRFSDSAKQSTFILIHPDSPMVQVLARKGSKDVEVIQNRIHETVQLLEDIKSEDTSLEILGHFLFNPFAAVIGDDIAVVNPFFISRGGRTVPAFKYQDTGAACYFQDLVKDVERLRMDAQVIPTSLHTSPVNEVLRIRPK